MPPTEHCSDHSGCQEAIANLKKADDAQWAKITLIERALTRLVPVWVALVLTVMGSVTGASLSIAVMVIKFYEK